MKGAFSQGPFFLYIIKMSNKVNSKLENKVYGGLINSSDSFFIYNSIKNDKTPSLIVTSNGKQSHSVALEISTFSKEIASRLIYIPETDEMPYDEVDSSLSYSSKKNFKLYSLIDNKEKIQDYISNKLPTII